MCGTHHVGTLMASRWPKRAHIMASRWQKRHFDVVARVLRESAEALTGDAARTTIALITSKLGSEFIADNPRFDPERFVEACQPRKEQT